jgi:hypothetical protein
MALFKKLISASVGPSLYSFNSRMISAKALSVALARMPDLNTNSPEYLSPMKLLLAP